MEQRSRGRHLAGIVAVVWFLAAAPAPAPAYAQTAFAQTVHAETVHAQTVHAETPTGGLLRVGHLSPTTPAVDVYVSAEGAAPATTPEARGAAYGAVTGYESLAPGRYTVSMRPAGAPAASPPAVTSTVDVAAGSAQSLMFFDTGSGGVVQGEVLADNRSAPAAGAGLVRVVQGAQGVGPVDIEAVDGPRLATALAYGAATEYRSVAAKPWDVAVVAGADRVQANLVVADGSVTTVLLSRNPAGALTATPVVDSAGADPATGANPLPPSAPAAIPVRPKGGVGAGGGGTAAGADPLPIVLGLGATLLLVLAVSELRRRRANS